MERKVAWNLAFGDRGEVAEWLNAAVLKCPKRSIMRDHGGAARS